MEIKTQEVDDYKTMEPHSIHSFSMGSFLADLLFGSIPVRKLEMLVGDRIDWFFTTHSHP